MAQKEENPFEDPVIAQQWMASVENEHGTSREKELYPLLTERVAEYKPQVVLEIGSGQGICSAYLGDSYTSYLGVEPSSVLVDRATELYGDDKRKFVTGNAYALPVETCSVDFVFSTMVWFHLRDLAMASKELVRVLKPEGHFLIVTANPSSYKVWETFFENHVVDDEKIVGTVSVPAGKMSKSIIYKHSLEDILTALKNTGLQVTTTKGFGYQEEYDDGGLFILIEGTK